MGHKMGTFSDHESLIAPLAAMPIDEYLGASMNIGLSVRGATTASILAHCAEGDIHEEHR